MRHLVALALAAVACGEAPPSDRDFTDAVCPAPVGDKPTLWRGFVCDRGRGYSPRYVTTVQCAEELGLRRLENPQGVARIDSTSPNWLRCFPSGVRVVTIADVGRSTFFAP